MGAELLYTIGTKVILIENRFFFHIFKKLSKIPRVITKKEKGMKRIPEKETRKERKR